MRRASILALLITLCAACGEPAPPAPQPLDGEALAFVQQLEQRVAGGRQPDALEVQRLKQLGLAHPEDPRVSQLLLKLLPGLRDWDGLAGWLEAKPELDADERLALAKVHVNRADLDAAWRLVEPLAAASPQALEPNALAARVAFLRGDCAAVAEHLERVWPAVVDSKGAEEMSFRAVCLLEAGELTRAREILEEALALEPDSVHAHNALSRVLAAAGDEAGALRHQARATALQAEISALEQRQMRRAAQNKQLNEAWARGDFEGCRALVLRFLVEAEPEQAAELLRFLEGMYRAAGREAEAAAALDEARALIPTSEAR